MPTCCWLLCCVSTSSRSPSSSPSHFSFLNSGAGRNDVVIIVDGLGSVVSFTILVSIGVSFPPAKTQSQQRRSWFSCNPLFYVCFYLFHSGTKQPWTIHNCPGKGGDSWTFRIVQGRFSQILASWTLAKIGHFAHCPGWCDILLTWRPRILDPGHG